MEIGKTLEPMRYEDPETGREYVLDFNRESVEFAEGRGFDWDYVGSRPMTMIPLIWYVAHRRYNPRIAKEKTDKLLIARGGIKPKELRKLRELYDQTFAPLIAEDDPEDEEGEGKNAE